MKIARIIIFILLGWTVASAIIFGPVIYSVTSLRGKISSTAYNIVAVPAMIICIPAYPVCFLSKNYYDYICWWALKGDPSIPNPPHDEFKKDILEIFQK
jgi:hypothetical protein